ncbi:MAG: stage V sporulation protein AA [Lachnospiraceae bacterium]|nr:stage V sporulation protein AA [Lachnospiraceae bacterium]
MKQDVVYVKVGQSVQVANKRITLEDLAEIHAWDYDVVKNLAKVVVLTVKGDKNEKNVVSSLKLIQLIQKEYPGVQVELIGEPSVVIEYRMPKPKKKGLEIAKLCLMTLIVFFGSAFTIMTFNTDVSVGDLFDQFYFLVMGEEKNGGSALELFYSIGIPIGILGFYNHYNPAKTKDDPTPIHVEMRNYEEEMNKAIIADAGRKGSEIT